MHGWWTATPLCTPPKGTPEPCAGPAFGYGTSTDGLHWTPQPAAILDFRGLPASTQTEVGGVVQDAQRKNGESTVPAADRRVSRTGVEHGPHVTMGRATLRAFGCRYGQACAIEWGHVDNLGGCFAMVADKCGDVDMTSDRLPYGPPPHERNARLLA